MNNIVVFGKNSIVQKNWRLIMHIVKRIAYFLMIVGAIVWLLIGLFNFNLVAFIFDNISEVISRIIYSLVGVAGIVSLVSFIMPDED